MVEDDTVLAESTSHFLSARGFEVSRKDCAESALEVIQPGYFDAAIFDVVLPGQSGLELVSALRARRINVPVLFLSALDRVNDRVNGLSAGADDYLCKPFALSELEARIRALIRRASMLNRAVAPLRAGEIEIDRVHRQVFRSGRMIDLRPKEYAVLEFLCENAGSVVSKTMLLERVWGYSFDTGTNIVDVVISRMRAKIERGFGTQLIRTVYGVGYALEIVQT